MKSASDINSKHRHTGRRDRAEVTPELKVLAFETESGTCVAKLGAIGFAAQSENPLVQQSTVFNPVSGFANKIEGDENAAHGSLKIWAVAS